MIYPERLKISHWGNRPLIIRFAFAAIMTSLVSIYLLSRCYRLLSMPIFLDESIHLEFAKAAMQGDALAGLSLGKWLAIQMYGYVLKLFSDNLLTARAVAVGLGCVSMACIIATGCAMSNSGGRLRGIFSGLTYVVIPYAVFMDRVALTDQFLAAIVAFMVMLSFRLAVLPTRLEQVGLGVALLALPLMKATGVVLMPLPFIIAAFFAEGAPRRRCLKRMLLPYAVGLPPVLCYILNSSSSGESAKLATVSGGGEAIVFVLVNARDILACLAGMFNWKFVVILTIGLVLVIHLDNRKETLRRLHVYLMLAVVIVAPYALFCRTWYPRYFFPIVVPACLFAGEILERMVTGVLVERKRHKGILMMAISIALLYFGLVLSSLRMILAPADYPFIERIRTQYVTGYTSGYGLEQVIMKLQARAQSCTQSINVVRAPKWEMPLFGIDAYYRALGPRVHRITIHPWSPEGVSEAVAKAMKDVAQTIFVFDSSSTNAYDMQVLAAMLRRIQYKECGYFPRPDDRPGLCMWELKLQDACKQE